MNTQPNTARIIRLSIALMAFVVLTEAKGACFYTGPDTVYYETVEPYETVYYEPSETVYVEETVTRDAYGSSVVVTETTTVSKSTPVYFGDIIISYDFDGFTCESMDIWGFDLAIYDWMGRPVVQEFDLPCDLMSEIQILDMEMGPYTLTLVGRDFWGFETLVADVSFTHEDWITPLYLNL